MSIELIIGPMYSGKTVELLRRMQRYVVASKRVALVKFRGDTRYGSDDIVRTHDGRALIECERIVHGSNILTENPQFIENAVRSYDVVGFDEGQFYDDLVVVASALADRGVSVVVSGLNGNFQRHPFPVIADLTAYADKILHLRAICMKCRSADAIFSVHTQSHHQQQLNHSDGATEYAPQIGGAEKWWSVCRVCRATLVNQTP